MDKENKNRASVSDIEAMTNSKGFPKELEIETEISKIYKNGSDAENIRFSQIEEEFPREVKKYLEKIKREISQIYTDMEAPAGIIKSSQNNN